MTTPRTTLTLLLTFALSACSAGPGEELLPTEAPPSADNCLLGRGQVCEDDAAPDEVDEYLGLDADTADSELPREGLYDVGFEGVVTNTCGPLVDTIAPSTVALDHVDTDRFSWLEGTECVVWSDLSYTCDLTVALRDVSPRAQLTIGTQAYGVVVDPVTLEEEQAVRIQCRGPGCDDYAATLDVSFPCEMVVHTAPTRTSRG